MSSPITKKRKTAFDQALIKLHQRASHSTRIQQLANTIEQILEDRFPERDGKLRALDIGCGDMALSRLLSKVRPQLGFEAIDIHNLPTVLENDPAWSNYRSFDGINIPFENSTFSFGLMCDVLHHVPPESRSALLREALRTCEILIIKDHFEYGWFSRAMLKAMDFVGNYGYGVAIPSRYFTNDTLSELMVQAGGSFQVELPSIDLYNHLPILSKVCRPEWQFIGFVHRL